MTPEDDLRITSTDPRTVTAAAQCVRSVAKQVAAIVAAHGEGPEVRPLSQARRRQLIVGAGPAAVLLGLLSAVVVGLVTMSLGWAVVALLAAGFAFLVLGVAVMLILGGAQSLRFFRR